jgi:carbohydrate-selective porin OprB
MAPHFQTQKICSPTKDLFTFMSLCQAWFYSGWVNLNLECQVVERFGKEANGQGTIGVRMSIANLLEDENVLNIKGLFTLKQKFIIKIV